jgi:hypothetical protein
MFNFGQLSDIFKIKCIKWKTSIKILSLSRSLVGKSAFSKIKDHKILTEANLSNQNPLKMTLKFIMKFKEYDFRSDFNSTSL